MLETFQLSRKSMAELLMAIKGETNKTPLALLQDAWEQSHKLQIETGNSLSAFISTELPAIFEKIFKLKGNKAGFSINEIVLLGNQIEFTNLTSSAVQNWVKRDIKGFIGSPQLGKKYTVDQAAILFIVEDLKSSLDFDSIRNVLTLLFNNPTDRSDDVINPLELYLGYATIFEKIHHHEDKPTITKEINETLNKKIEKETKKLVESFDYLTEEQMGIVQNVLIMAIYSVNSTFFQYLSKRYLNATLFLHGGQ